MTERQKSDVTEESPNETMLEKAKWAHIKRVSYALQGIGIAILAALLIIVVLLGYTNPFLLLPAFISVILELSSLIYPMKYQAKFSGIRRIR